MDTIAFVALLCLIIIPFCLLFTQRLRSSFLSQSTMSESEQASVIIYFIASVTCIICIIPIIPSFDQNLSIHTDMCPLNSSVHKGIQSAGFRESLLISLAIIFPMFVDLVFDTLGYFSVGFNSHCSYSTGLSTRWAIISSSLLSDLILLLYVVPSAHSQLMWTIYIMRETVRIFAIYDYLQQHGGPTWNPKLVLAKVTYHLVCSTINHIGENCPL
jgi:hypothetical protein